MDRKLLLAYLKLKVILFIMVVIGIPTAITWYIDILVTGILIGTNPLSAVKLLLVVYFQSLVLTFLSSLFWNVGKVIFKKENREFFLMK